MSLFMSMVYIKIKFNEKKLEYMWESHGNIQGKLKGGSKDFAQIWNLVQKVCSWSFFYKINKNIKMHSIKFFIWL